MHHQLDELFHHYGSDKANIFKSTKDKGHGFSSFYSKKLDYLKDSNINILEVGSYAGASAAAFKKYFAGTNTIDILASDASTASFTDS